MANKNLICLPGCTKSFQSLTYNCYVVIMMKMKLLPFMRFSLRHFVYLLAYSQGSELHTYRTVMAMFRRKKWPPGHPRLPQLYVSNSHTEFVWFRPTVLEEIAPRITSGLLFACSRTTVSCIETFIRFKTVLYCRKTSLA